MEEVKEIIEEAAPSFYIFIDLKKAFDTVDPKLLLETLENVGIRGLVTDIFRKYLLKRTQYV